MVKLNLLMLQFAIKLLYVTYSASTGHDKITVQFCVRIFESKKLCIYAMPGCDEVYRTPKNLTIKRKSKETSLKSMGS